MAAITWRNVNAPNYGAANALLQSGNKAMSEGINSFGDTLTAEGDRRKGINTDKAKAFAASMQGLDNFGDRRAEYMAGLGNNIDRSAVSDAFNLRKEGLQGDQTFANDLLTFKDDRATSKLERDALEYENSDPIRKLALKLQNSEIASNNASTNRSNVGAKYDSARIAEQEAQLGRDAITRDQKVALNGILTRIDLTDPKWTTDGFLDAKKLESMPALAGFPQEMLTNWFTQNDDRTGATATRENAAAFALKEQENLANATATAKSDKIAQSKQAIANFGKARDAKVYTDAMLEYTNQQGKWLGNGDKIYPISLDYAGLVPLADTTRIMNSLRKGDHIDPVKFKQKMDIAAAKGEGTLADNIRKGVTASLTPKEEDNIAIKQAEIAEQDKPRLAAMEKKLAEIQAERDALVSGQFSKGGLTSIYRKRGSGQSGRNYKR